MSKPHLEGDGNDLAGLFRGFLSADRTSYGVVGTGSAETVRAIGALGLAILRLDKTSSRLAVANISLTGALLVLGIIQICLMFGHR